jgi:RNA polymerase sigma-70 factor (ECF subfamily)
VREQKAFQSYLFTIAVRLNRAERKRNAQRQPLSEEHSDIASSAATDAQADIPQLYTALDRLPREQREAIVMSEIVGLSLAEVAEAQHASLSAVKTRVSRGRKRLAKLLGVDDERDQSAYVVSPVSANGSGSYHARFAFQAKEKL